MENWFRLLQIASIIMRPYGDSSMNFFLGMLTQVSLVDSLKVKKPDYGYTLPTVEVNGPPTIVLHSYKPSNNDTVNISNSLIPHLVKFTDGRPNSKLVRDRNGNLMRITYVRPTESERRELLGGLVPSRRRHTYIGGLQKPVDSRWRANAYAERLTSRDLLQAFPNGIDHLPDSDLVKKNSSEGGDFTYWALNRYLGEWILISHENIKTHTKIKGSMVLSEDEFTPLLDKYDQPVYTQYGGGNPRLKLANTLENHNAYARSLALSLVRCPLYTGFDNDYTGSNTVGTYRLFQHEKRNQPPPSKCVHVWDAINRRVFVVNMTGAQKEFITVFNFYGINEMDKARESSFLKRGDVYR